VNLRTLSLQDNSIASLPSTLCSCTDLRELNLQNNKLEILPEHIGYLYALKRLHLSKNKLVTLPTSINELIHLEMLDVSKNKLQNIPSLSNMRSLTILTVMENNIETLPVFPIAGKLATIQFGYNLIREINTEVLEGSKQSIAELHINNNRISVIPLPIALLINIKVIDVSNNDITDVPCTLGYIKSLHRIVLDGNPIRSIRRTLLG
jgi:Leucine-rich repeat (LRR) protein